MNRSVKNFILAVLIGSALFVAGLSSNANGNFHSDNLGEVSTKSQTVCFLESKGNRDSEFWSKFRDSVMPDEKNPSNRGSSRTDNPGNPPPPQPQRN